MAAERVEGVREAEFSYPEAIGTVTLDTTLTSISEVIAELTRATGFGATVRDKHPAAGEH